MEKLDSYTTTYTPKTACENKKDKRLNRRCKQQNPFSQKRQFASAPKRYVMMLSWLWSWLFVVDGTPSFLVTPVDGNLGLRWGAKEEATK